MINFYEKKKYFFTLSLAIMVAGIIGMFVNGINLNIQFTGGAIIKYTYTGDIDPAQVADFAKTTLDRNADAAITTDIVTGTNKVVLSLSGQEGLSAQDQEKLDASLKDKFKDNGFGLSESNIVEPFIGQRFLQNSLFSLILSFLLIVIYVWIRFKRISGLSAGVSAVIALLHDVAVVFFTFILFRIPINESFIAVSLTIIGYSINDTIVIYDRIRENKNLYRKMSTPELVNKSINQSMSRTINTTATTVICMTIVYIFSVIYGIESIKIFSLPMTMGLITGAYSTIFVAGPIWAMWQVRKEVQQ